MSNITDSVAQAIKENMESESHDYDPAKVVAKVARDIATHLAAAVPGFDREQFLRRCQCPDDKAWETLRPTRHT